MATTKPTTKPIATICWTTHEAGYDVVAIDDQGNLIQEYTAGNSRQDSYSFEPDPAYALTPDELEDYARKTATEMAEELRSDGYAVCGVEEGE